MTTPALLTQFFQQYQQTQTKRALGGIYALQGFDFQIECYLADLLQHLAKSDTNGIHNSLSAFEQLQDHTLVNQQQQMVTMQAKRTLTSSTLKKALEEIATVEKALEQFLKAHNQSDGLNLHYQIITQRCDLPEKLTKPKERTKPEKTPQPELDWQTLLLNLYKTPSDDRAESANALKQEQEQPQEQAEQLALLNSLYQQQRLLPILVRPYPKWQGLSAIWQQVPNPIELWRKAYQHAVRITPDSHSASVIHEQICELYLEQKSEQKQILGALGEWLTPEHFATAPKATQLEIGKPATISRLNNQQYMQREAHLRDICQELTQLPHKHRGAEAIPVFWIAGRSGSGKSVLLLQLIKHLVNQGEQVVWLGNKVEQLKPLLEGYLHHLNSGGEHSASLFPNYIAIDDMYDPNAQTRLDQLAWQDLADAFEQNDAFKQAAAAGTLPTILTCGPTEFAQQFESDIEQEGFVLHQFKLALVRNEESQQLKHWYQQRFELANSVATNNKGDAYLQAEQGNGLILSLVMELNYQDISRFAKRFAKRIVAANLTDVLRIPLALNRLYINMPTNWYTPEDLERFDTLNSDEDLNPLELDSEAGNHSTENISQRLTHPHLGDALYKALLREKKADNKTGYTNDLVSAFKWAISQDHLLYFQLLKTFSGVQRHFTTDQSNAVQLQSERLAKVNQTSLATQCAAIWQQSEIKDKQHRYGTYINVNWAVWAVQQPQITEQFSTPPLELALQAMEHNRLDWPNSWSSLNEHYKNHSSLKGWALKHLSQPEFITHKSWSFVWEALSSTHSSETQWLSAGTNWLTRHHHRPDWHFVWKVLHQLEKQDNWPEKDFTPTDLGYQHIKEHSNSTAWAHVFQDLLANTDLGDTASRAYLINQGINWLKDRENQPEWTHIWQTLIALHNNHQLPQEINSTPLIKQGADWLKSREDQPEWAYVWQTLITLHNNNQLPETIDGKSLIQQGADWLKSRENQPEWNYVWRTLIALHNDNRLPETIDGKSLILQGINWLKDREDQPEWSYIWRTLITLHNNNQLPETIDGKSLILQGINWLKDRENQPEWTHVWRTLIALHNDNRLPTATDIDSETLIQQGYHWLKDREDQPEWTHVWQTLIALHNNLQLPRTIESETLIQQGYHWLKDREDQQEWNFVWRTLLEIADSNIDSTIAKQHLASSRLAWLQQQQNLLQKEVGFVVEILIDAHCDKPEFLRQYQRWFTEHAKRSKSPKTDWQINAIKFIALAPYSEFTNECATTLNEFLANCPNHFVVKLLNERIATITAQPHTAAVSALISNYRKLADHPVWQQLEKYRMDQQAIPFMISKKGSKWTAVNLAIDSANILASLPTSALNQANRRAKPVCYIHGINQEKGQVTVGVSPIGTQRMTFKEFTEKYHVGDTVKGIVNNIVDYGVFVSCLGQSGLLHRSEIPSDIDFKTEFKIGDEIEVTLINIDTQKQRLSFGYFR